ncbi:hypothetical protein NEMIN01_2147 [Nematocida minor]|uniref:uncharacterized protein n=1 Tax=Nematocida minor TaxID=1912983 RepID=UPI00222081A1|nr:uncharacterized protein NEMIN01_2147 [Nematocida minor]KAI5192680.1 hypothetical protein NEMIN01_2147 [Nematocida minor]
MSSQYNENSLPLESEKKARMKPQVKRVKLMDSDQENEDASAASDEKEKQKRVSDLLQKIKKLNYNSRNKSLRSRLQALEEADELFKESTPAQRLKYLHMEAKANRRSVELDTFKRKMLELIQFLETTETGQALSWDEVVQRLAQIADAHGRIREFVWPQIDGIETGLNLWILKVVAGLYFKKIKIHEVKKEILQSPGKYPIEWQRVDFSLGGPRLMRQLLEILNSKTTPSFQERKKKKENSAMSHSRAEKHVVLSSEIPISLGGVETLGHVDIAAEMNIISRKLYETLRQNGSIKSETALPHSLQDIRCGEQMYPPKEIVIDVSYEDVRLDNHAFYVRTDDADAETILGRELTRLLRATKETSTSLREIFQTERHKACPFMEFIGDVTSSDLTSLSIHDVVNVSSDYAHNIPDKKNTE